MRPDDYRPLAGKGSERGALALLAGLPFLFFLWRWASGQPVLNGDNLIQNYPLRVLAGAALRSGHLPLWNPYLWSGTPLLAGFNAGAAYPLSWLFAMLPPHLAWSLTLAVTYALAATGFYLFLRGEGRGVTAAFLGAASFAFGGFMVSQMVHVETVEGVAWLPWAALAVKRLLFADSAAAVRRRVAAAGFLGGLVILGGSPEAMAYGAAFIAVLSLWWVFSRPPALRGRLAGRLGAAALLALAVGAAQWLPGEAFIHLSQRARASYAFFSSMSLPLPALVLGLVPYVLGGYGVFWVPMHYAGPLNLPELGWYIGLLPVAAALALAPGLLRAGGRSRTGIWYLTGAVGLLWALGNHTPLGLLLYHIPVLNGLRAQNRNLFWVDFALAALFAIWVDDRLAEPAPARRVAWGTAGALAGFFALALVLGRLAAAPAVNAHTGGYIAGTIALAGAAVLLAARVGTAPVRWRRILLVAFTALDLGLYDGAQYWTLAPRPSPDTGLPPAAARLAALAGGDRYAVYNPRLYHYSLMDALGQPDLNILTGTPSVQGYGSLVSQAYQQATGSHIQGTLNPAWLNGTLVARLQLKVLLVPPDYLAQPLAAVPAAARRHPAVRLTQGKPWVWFFGRLRALRTLSLAPAPGRTVPASGWKIAVLTPAGQVRPLSPGSYRISAHGGVLSFRFLHPATAAGVVLTAPEPLPVTVFAAAASRSRRRPLLLAGPLAGGLSPAVWRYHGLLAGDYAIFLNRQPGPGFWIQGGGGRAQVSPAGSGPQGQARFRVDAPRPLRLVRSEAYQPGWQAVITPITAAGRPAGPARILPVTAAGVVQAVSLPAGRETVEFVYRPGSVAWGIGISAAGLMLLLGLVLVPARRRTAVGSVR